MTLAKFDMTEADYEALLQRQKFACAICYAKHIDDPPGKPGPGRGKSKRLHLDHDHVSGKVRGLLCRRCNTVLGLMEENNQLFENSVAYLHKYAYPRQGSLAA